MGGRKGIKSAALLIFTFIFFFFPLLRRGMAPILAGLLTALILLAVTIGLISGLNRKGFVTFLSTFGGVVTLGIAVLVFGWMTNLSGYNVENIENLMFAAQNTMIDVGQLLLAGILFTSLGAVMDIAMDVTSACAELVTHAEQLTRKELFLADLSVYRSLITSMTFHTCSSSTPIPLVLKS